MAGYAVTYRETNTPDTTRNPSPDLWADCPLIDLKINNGTLPFGSSGVYFEDDFTNIPLAPTLTTQIAYGNYKAYATSGETVAGLGGTQINSVTVPGGILACSLGTGLAHATSLAQAYASYWLSGTAGNAGKLWFECRIAVSSVAANHCNFFVGLGEVDQITLSATAPFNDSETVISNSGALIGFNLRGALAGNPKFVYADRATSFTNVLTGINVGPAPQAADAAFQFMKLGFKYDPAATAPGTVGTGTAGSGAISIWADNVLQGTFMTLSTLAGTTYLGANNLGLILANIAGTSASSDFVWMDWWRCAQLYPN